MDEQQFSRAAQVLENYADRLSRRVQKDLAQAEEALAKR